MRIVDNRGITDPRLNLALEEHIVRTAALEGGLMLLYVDDPAVIVGRNQTVVEEIDGGLLRERGIEVVRRISGGGAVYHDRGNLNLTFFTAHAPERLDRHQELTQSVVEVLREIGVPAELNARNDIVAEGRKISGNAQFASRGRTFTHRTLLVDSDLELLTEVLLPKSGRVESTSYKSVRSRVANISEFLSDPLSTSELKSRIVERMCGGDAGGREYPLGEADWVAVNELADQKFRSWRWNHGESPAFTLEHVLQLPEGETTLRVRVERGGSIVEAEINGEGIGGDGALDSLLRGVRFERAALSEVASGMSAVGPENVRRRGALLGLLESI